MGVSSPCPRPPAACPRASSRSFCPFLLLRSLQGCIKSPALTRVPALTLQLSRRMTIILLTVQTPQVSPLAPGASLLSMVTDQKHTFTWASQGPLVVKNPLANAGDARDVGSIPVLGRSPGEGHGNPLQHCLQHPKDRGVWQAPGKEFMGLQRVRHD